MSGKVVIPSGRALASLPPELAEWVRQVTLAINGGIQGANRVDQAVNTGEGIRKGTVTIDAVVEGVGRVSEALAVQADNQTAATSGGTALSGSLSAQNLFASRGANNISTTPTVTVTPSGGSGNYSIAWTVSDPSVTITAPASGTTAFTRPSPNDYTSARATVTITDTDDNSTVQRFVSLAFPGRPATIDDFNEGGGGGPIP